MNLQVEDSKSDEIEKIENSTNQIFRIDKKTEDQVDFYDLDFDTLYKARNTKVHPTKFKLIDRGDLIGDRYRVCQVYRRGMRNLYICQDINKEEMVVLKTLSDELVYSDKLKNQFKEEALIWISLESHPHLVKALRFKYFQGRPFIILEYIPPDEYGSNTLDDYLHYFIPPKRALKWAIQFCEAMEYATRNGVTAHRDIKPANIMITPNKQLKITDFGLANTTTEQDAYICGTPPWMAPEQFRGEADIRSDIYSFGIVLYQMANGGALPFYAGGESTEEKIENWYHVQKTEKVPYAASRLIPVIFKCMEKDPDDRYENFTALKKDLVKLNAMEHYYDGLTFNAFHMDDKAVEQFRKAIKIDPDFADAYISLGYTLKKDQSK